MTPDEIIGMARQAGLEFKGHGWIADESGYPSLESFTKLVAAKEREACAKVADLVAKEVDDTNGVATYIGKAIRARGKE